MTYEEFINLVRDMREAQGRYFNTRKKDDLVRAKFLERDVDMALMLGSKNGN